jgi:hypothetical protein
MSNAPANQLGSTHRPLSLLMPARDLTAYLWRLFRIWIAAIVGEHRERALWRAERHPAMMDRSFGRLHRDVLKIEARRVL